MLFWIRVMKILCRKENWQDQKRSEVTKVSKNFIWDGKEGG